jgi:hypothetical protein
MVAETESPVHRPTRSRRGFREWRRRRTFWGGLFLVLAGAEMFASGIAPVHVIVHLGLEGLAGQVIPILIAVCGLLVTFSPEQRPFYAVVAALLSVASWITSNLGGFVVGLVLGLVGASLVFAWSEPREPESET